MSGARGSFKFVSPTQVSAVSAWLRLAQGTTSAGKYTVIPDVLANNPAVQPDTDRQPTAASSANGLPVATWNGANIFTWPAAANNASTAKWGFMVWVKTVSNIGARQRIFHTPAGSNTKRQTFDIVSGGIATNIYQTDGNGRDWSKTSGITASAWQCIRFAFDGSAVLDDDKIQVFVNEAKVTGASIGTQGTLPTMTALQAAGGTNLLGAGPNDVDSPGAPLLNGVQTGPNWFVFNDSLLAADAVRLMNFEAPT